MLQNCSLTKVASVFFREPTTPHYLKEISEKSKLAHTSVINYLALLKTKNIISLKLEKKGKRTFPIYVANIENASYRRYKIVYNLSVLLESGVIDVIKDAVMPKSIILFGSYLRGEDIEDSDIDLFVEAKERQLDLKKYKKKLNRKIQLHFKQDINAYPAELKNNIINGLPLYGAIEIK